MILSKSGAVVSGTVKSASGVRLSDAVVAIVPDSPLRNSGMHYRSAISDINGRFELRGIAPGDYHLFAWEDLPGAAYLSAEFMRKYEENGTPVHIDKTEQVSVDVSVEF